MDSYQSYRILPILYVVLTLAVGIVIGFAAKDVIAQGPPLTAAPVAAPRSVNPSQIELQTLAGRGIDVARLALQASLPQLPFKARLPQYLPSGMRLAHSSAQVLGAERKYANLNLSYIHTGTGTENKTLHIYETNQSLQGKESEQTFEVRTMLIGSEAWSYQLLSYPQPNGSVLRLHNLRHTFEDAVYVDMDIEAGSDPEPTLAELVKVASSLH